MVRKYLSKKYNINIVNCKTVSDKNKIALSTRNNLLSKNKYSQIIKIVKEFKLLKKRLLFNKNYLKISLFKMAKKIEKQYKIKIDYLEIRDEKKLLITKIKNNTRLFIAFYINKIRIIDNFLLY